MNDSNPSQNNPSADGAPQISSPLIRTNGWSRHLEFDPNFVDKIAGAVCKVLADYAAGEMEVVFHVPHWAKLPEHGFLILNFNAAAQPKVCIGLDFGELLQDQSRIRRVFDVDAWRRDPGHSFSSNIAVATFEEAWAFLCYVGRELRVTTVRLTYGV